MPDTLYGRLGGYDAIAAVSDDLLVRLRADAQLARFWQNRAEDSIRREKQLLIDFLCSVSGGALYYVGRDMKTSHRGMGVSESDWQAFLVHLEAIHEGKAFEMNWRGADGDRIRTVICIRRVSGRNLKWSKFCDLGRVTARVRETEEKFHDAAIIAVAKKIGCIPTVLCERCKTETRWRTRLSPNCCPGTGTQSILPAPPLRPARHPYRPSPVLKIIVRPDHQIDVLALRFGFFQLAIDLRRNRQINVRIGRAVKT